MSGAFLRFSRQTGIVYEPLANMMKSAVNLDRQSVDRILAGDVPAGGTAFERVFGIWEGVGGASDFNGYLADKHQDLFRAISSEYRRGINAGNFWPSVRTVLQRYEDAANGTAMVIDESTLADLASQAAKEGIDLDWGDRIFGGAANVLGFTLDTAIDVVGLASAGEFSTQGNMLPRFKVKRDSYVTNMSQVEGWMASRIRFYATANGGDLEAATEQAALQWKANHIVVNNRAIYTGTAANTPMVQQVVRSGVMDDVLAEFKRSGRAAGYDLEDLKLEPVSFGDPTRWKITGPGGEYAGGGQDGVDTFTLDDLYERARRRQNEEASVLS